MDSVMPLSAVSLVTLALGLALTVAAIRQLRRGRLMGASLRGLCAMPCMVAAVTSAGIIANLYTYHRLTHEQPIATLEFAQLAPQHFQVVMREANNTTQTFELRGDEWQLDARVLKWHGWANLLGLDARYRLERLAGRYRDIEQENNATRTAHALSEQRGIDLWRLDRRLSLKLIDADFGSATYLPMADTARFEISLAQSGLVARPLNAAAANIVSQWP